MITDEREERATYIIKRSTFALINTGIHMCMRVSGTKRGKKGTRGRANEEGVGGEKKKNNRYIENHRTLNDGVIELCVELLD